MKSIRDAESRDGPAAFLDLVCQDSPIPQTDKAQREASLIRMAGEFDEQFLKAAHLQIRSDMHDTQPSFGSIECVQAKVSFQIIPNGARGLRPIRFVLHARQMDFPKIHQP